MFKWLMIVGGGGCSPFFSDGEVKLDVFVVIVVRLEWSFALPFLRPIECSKGAVGVENGEEVGLERRDKIVLFQNKVGNDMPKSQIHPFG